MTSVDLAVRQVGEGDWQHGVMHGCATTAGVKRAADGKHIVASARKRYLPKVSRSWANCVL